jgi:hypothetical protein
MAFNNNNNFNSGNQGGEKKKTNFRIGKIWGSDGVLDVSIWLSDTGARAILSIKSAVGKDPSSGNNVFEQKMPNELPRFFLAANAMNALIGAVAATPDLGNANIVIDKGNNNKLTVMGQGNQIKLTIDSAKQGSRTITLDALNIGGKLVHADFNILIDYLKICYKKALTAKLDPEEFGMAVAAENNGEDDGNVPF